MDTTDPKTRDKAERESARERFSQPKPTKTRRDTQRADFARKSRAIE